MRRVLLLEVGKGSWKCEVGSCGAKCGGLVRKRLGKVGAGLDVGVGERGFYVNGYNVGFSLGFYDFVENFVENVERVEDK